MIRSATRINRLPLVLALPLTELAAVSGAPQDDIVGHGHGTLDTAQQRDLRVLFHIGHTERGLVATGTRFDQGGEDIPGSRGRPRP